MLKLRHLFAAIVLAIAVSACSDNSINAPDASDATTSVVTKVEAENLAQSLSTTTEGFESGTKTSYATATVTLGTGSWTLSDALIGSSSSDRFVGSRSARVINNGRITMNFDRSAGAGTITVRHAVFGSDGASSWELWASTNGGSTWTKIGSTVTTSSATLQTASFTANIAGTVRIEIRKVSGGGNRINIDDISITSFSLPPPPASVHLNMGNPSGAVASVNSPTNYLMEKVGYALSYHRDKGIPNWVSWHLDASWLGSTPRQDDFRADNALPADWYRVSASSYSGSGFDRGHNCPSADRTRTVAHNSETFLMTNMIPQAPDNNQGPWVRMEDYIRSLVNQGNECYVIMGQYGVGGTGSNGYRTTIDNGRVTVPQRIWKVVVVLPAASGDDATRVTTSTRVIAVDMPNTQGIRNNNWGSYRTTVDAIEAAAGVDLLSRVPASIQAVIESRVDNGPTQ
ncbi:MAG: DNA/RNA non-specific endonuclease [Chloroherpetonaceae bacterium]|nr:DNA/RNA non-specific endonuclease [Chloroherpetonaceae bacterium]MDW8438292.1 DNA/RNA non-specific endonuclease [Chloroherpetonaceae bacterium]